MSGKLNDKLLERYFTKGKQFDPFFDVYDTVEWKKVDVKIKDWQTGEVIYEGHNLQFPEHYSQQACDIIASKYFYRDTDGEGQPEISLRNVIHRMVSFWTEALIDEGLLDDYLADKSYYDEIDRTIPINHYSGEAEIFYDECVYTLLHQMWAPNSPQWFNTGIGYYGVKGDPDDFYYYDDTGLHKSLDRYTRSQTSACFIIPVSDHLVGKDSITDHYVTETKLFKGGSGVGTNFSPIRAAGERLSSGGHSSGVMSFLLGLDRNAGAIKSGGTTRRAAKMVILDINHPDIEEFIDWKVHEEKKARDLIGLGYDGSMNGEAYQTVSGQNSNNSVRLNKTFMDKVLGIDPDPMFWLRGRKDRTLDRQVNALELWDKIAYAAWDCADPGVQFDDRYNEWHTAPNAGKINATNPCSEYAFIDNSACNLASINVAKFFGEANRDTEGFIKLVNLCQLVLEASIHWGHFPTADVAENSYKYRATGLGMCNLGSVFLQKGYPYDSDDARKLAGYLAGLMTGQSYLTSAKMAGMVGACEGFKDNKEALCNVLEKHKAQTEDSAVQELFSQAIFLTYCNGVRNMQTTVMAPTGTISLAMDCETTGIEPFFSHKLFKKCSDGSVMVMTNPLAKNYLNTCEELDETKWECEDIEDYYDDNATYQGAPHLDERQQAVLATANEISPMGHIKMMAAIQPFISGSISKTVNLPHTASVEEVKEIYTEAYKLGLKSISIYRDGSKGTQPLVTKLEDDDIDIMDEGAKLQELPYISVISKEEFVPKEIALTVSDNQKYLIRASQEYIEIESNQIIDSREIKKEFENVRNECGSTGNSNNVCSCANHAGTELTRNKPEGIRKSVTHTAKIGNVELYITVSYYDNGKLCEIFVSSDREGTTIKGLLSSLSKSISHMLQYGVEPEDIATMLRNQQYEPAGHVERHPYIKMCTSISDLIARIIEFECGDYTRLQVKPKEQDGVISEEITLMLEGFGGKSLDEYKESNEYTGSECSICHGSRMVRNGSCELCLDCGNTSGCS